MGMAGVFVTFSIECSFALGAGSLIDLSQAGLIGECDVSSEGTRSNRRETIAIEDIGSVRGEILQDQGPLFCLSDGPFTPNFMEEVADCIVAKCNVTTFAKGQGLITIEPKEYSIVIELFGVNG
jgi:hypothetical protein